MLANITTLLALSTLVSARPHVERDDKPVLEGSCKKTNDKPTEEQYIIGYNSFCDNYVKADGPVAGGFHYLPSRYDSLTATYDLLNWKQETVRWVFKITCHGKKPTGGACYVNNAMCKQRWRTSLETDHAGGLGKAYCVVDDTGGDGFGGRKGKPGMSGEGQVLVMSTELSAGKYKEQKAEDSWLTYYHYQRTPGP